MIGRLGRAYLLAALAAAACRGAAGTPGGPRLTARWTGADTAEFSAPAEAEWCGLLRVLEIRAVAGDTGVGIALYRIDSVQPGTYPMRLPDSGDTTGPPSAAMGLRWSSRTAVMGFQSDSGELELERGHDGLLAGRFTVAARPLTGKGRLQVTGSFDALRAARAAATCAGQRPGSAARADSVPGEEPDGDAED